MTKARLYKKDKAFGLELEGHAGYAPYGHDLICAAVSTLAFALDSYLDRLDSKALLIERQAMIMDRGRAKMEAKPEAQSRDRLKGALELTGCFLALLQENYPGNIEFTDDFGKKRRNNHDKQA